MPNVRRKGKVLVGVWITKEQERELSRSSRSLRMSRSDLIRERLFGGMNHAK